MFEKTSWIDKLSLWVTLLYENKDLLKNKNFIQRRYIHILSAPKGAWKRNSPSPFMKKKTTDGQTGLWGSYTSNNMLV